MPDYGMTEEEKRATISPLTAVRERLSRAINQAMSEDEYGEAQR
jgi:hypothetical protein